MTERSTVKPNELQAARNRLGQMIVLCLGCERVWLASGLRYGDTYICKECGHRSVIDQRRSLVARHLPPAQVS
jgi:DNA-directed RNA polymerase subunit RPC12/RpoP